MGTPSGVAQTLHLSSERAATALAGTLLAHSTMRQKPVLMMQLSKPARLPAEPPPAFLGQAAAPWTAIPPPQQRAHAALLRLETRIHCKHPELAPVMEQQQQQQQLLPEVWTAAQ